MAVVVCAEAQTGQDHSVRANQISPVGVPQLVLAKTSLTLPEGWLHTLDKVDKSSRSAPCSERRNKHIWWTSEGVHFLGDVSVSVLHTHSHC